MIERPHARSARFIRQDVRAALGEHRLGGVTIARFAALLFALPFCAGREHSRAGSSADPSASTPAPSPLPLPSGSASASADAVPADAGPPSLVREEKTVVVDDASERWRLVWRSTPVFISDVPWRTPRGGAFEETGDLDLVRVSASGEEERLNLGGLSEEGTLHVPRWYAAERSDFELPPPPIEVIKTRPDADVMRLADYDGDGRATELVIALAAGRFSSGDAIVVGISRANPHLHVFGTTEKPSKRLALPRTEQWDNVLHGDRPRVTERYCSDRVRVGTYREVWRDPLGLHEGGLTPFACGKGDPPSRVPGVHLRR